MKLKLLLLLSLTFSSALIASEERLNLFRDDRIKNRYIVSAGARMVITKQNQVAIRMTFKVPKVGTTRTSCLPPSRRRTKSCKLVTLMSYPRQLHYDESAQAIYFNDTLCAKVKDRRVFFGKKVTLTKNCMLSTKKTRGFYSINLIKK